MKCESCGSGKQVKKIECNYSYFRLCVYCREATVETEAHRIVLLSMLICEDVLPRIVSGPIRRMAREVVRQNDKKKREKKKTTS